MQKNTITVVTMKQLCSLSSFSFILLLTISLHPVKTLSASSSSPEPSPAPAGPTNVIKILKKAGHFKTLIRLMKETQLDSNLNSQLGDTNNGMTILAPSDEAFATVKATQHHSLKHLNRQDKMKLVQFHIIPIFISSSLFDTVTNPLKTHAGSGGRFSLNVTTNGDQVNMTTGLTNATVGSPVYVDKNLAIYQVDKVLLPLELFGPKEPDAPSPAPDSTKVKKKNKEESDDGDDSDGNGDDVSDGSTKKHKSSGVSNCCKGFNVLFLVICVNVVFAWLW